MEKSRVQMEALNAELLLLKEVRRVMGRQGVQHFLLSGVVRELDHYTSGYLQHLTSSLKLVLISEVRPPHQ